MRDKLIFALLIASWFAVYWLGWFDGREGERDEAMKAGVAYRTKRDGAWTFVYEGSR